MLGAELGEGARDRLVVAAVADAGQLARDAGRARQRAEEVHHRADREFSADRDHVAHRRVVVGREHEAEADLLDAAGDRLGRQVDPGAQRLQHVGGAGEAGGGAVAVLGDGAAGTGRDQRRGRGDVEGLSAAARADDVEQVVASDLDVGREGAHRAGQAGQLVDRLPLRAQRDQHGGDLDVGRVAAPDLGEDGGGGVRGEVLPGGERVDRAREQVLGSHQAAADSGIAFPP